MGRVQLWACLPYFAKLNEVDLSSSCAERSRDGNNESILYN